MPKQKKKISVIIISWNLKEITDKCLTYMKKAVDYTSKVADVEVIVVENDSSDGSPEMITKKHPWAKLYKTGANLGYAKGNNYGEKKTDQRSDYLLILNNDAYVREDTLVNCLSFMEEHPKCDVLGCGLQYEDGRFQPSAGYLPTPSSTVAWIWGLNFFPIIKKWFKPVHPKNHQFFSQDKEMGWVMGAFLFMKHQVFTATKGYDENFFMYMEEVEWCRRIHDMGYHIWYSPKFSITHIDKASAFKDPVNLAKIFRKEILGLIYYLKKYYPDQIVWLLPIIKTGIRLRWLVFIALGNKIRQDGYAGILKEL